MPLFRLAAILLALALAAPAAAQQGAMTGRKNPGPWAVGFGAGMGGLGLTLGAVGLGQGLAKETPCEEEGFCIRAPLVVGGILYVVGAPVLAGGAYMTRNWYRDQGYEVSGVPAQIGLGFAIAGIIAAGTGALVKDPNARTWLVVGALPAAMTLCYGFGIAQVFVNRTARKAYRLDGLESASARWDGRPRVALAPVGVQQGAGLGLVGVW